MKTKTKKQTKQDLSTYLDRINLRGFAGNIRRIAEAYSDCFVAEMCEMQDAQRNLNFLEVYPIKSSDLLLIAEHIIGNYNQFSTSQVQQVINVFGEDALYFVAREGSPCIYVKPIKGNIWIERGCTGLNSIKADEVMFDAALGMFRVWWD